MSNFRHIKLCNWAKDVTFKSKPARGGVLPTPADALAHAQQLHEGYISALASFRQKKEELPEGAVAASGSYIDVIVKKDALLETWKSLDTKRGAQVMNMRSSDDESNKVTLYLTENRTNWLNNKLNAYSHSADTDNRRSRKLIDALDAVSPVRLESFFTVSGDYETVSDRIEEYEIWITGTEVDAEDIKHRIASVGVEYRNRTLTFDCMMVVLVKANREHLEMLPQVIDRISEIRKFRRPSILTNPEKGMQESREWESLIHECVPVEDNLVKVGILDSGVNHNHPLLNPFLPEDRCHSALADANLRDRANHGTGMAGLVLYGDLIDVIYDRDIKPITNELVSVKVIANTTNPDATDEHTAIILEDAIRKSEEDDAHLMTMAVTATESQEAIASATSAAIDETLYNDGTPESLLLVSAGNVDNNDGVGYPDYLWNNSVNDPAQSWNALTVGAFTEKIVISDVEYEGRQIVAPYGGVSPFSRTSRLWDNNMLIKPEILMEGGNAYWDGEGYFQWHDDLMLATTDARDYCTFSAFNATSAATALAGRLAGAIKHYNPELSALSIRALMVHSASWTNAMRNICTINGHLDMDLLVHTCGYGVPNWNKAVATHESYVTFIAEGELKPFAQGSGNELKHSNMHLFKLPWPKDILLDLGETEVTMRVTLSYYIQPSPGIKGKLKKFSYPSELLRFEVSTSQDTEDTFIHRVANTANEGEDVLSNDTNRWRIGINRRNQGSIHSDFICETAAQIAAYDKIAIYPATGWWKTRKSMLEKGIKYALVVSLETPNVDIYTPISQIIESTVEIPNS